ncbi:MAG: hypothetical protein BMS9Abin28_1886 [Anaerolineae bacterium]|nr:MAG: hypothetical protein BMS9Abin28_1886 [Anaerolineae bacterium]
MSDELFQELYQSVIDGEKESAVALAEQALDQGVDPLSCINEGLTKGIQIVGELSNDGQYYLPQLIMGAEAMKGAKEATGWVCGAPQSNRGIAERSAD